MNATAQQQNTNVVQLAPARLAMSPSIAKEYEITAPQWRVLVEQTFPNAKSIEGVLMALEYCRARNLDILKRPVHIVPMWDSKKKQYVETVWPGISEIRTTAHRTGEYAGCDDTEFGPEITTVFQGRVKEGTNWVDREVTVKHPEWAKVTVYRLVKGHRVAFSGPKVFWKEAAATIGKSDLPNDMWRKRTYGQLDKCAEAAALRKAFPEEIGGEYTAEEMHGQIIEHEIKADPEQAPEPATMAPPPPPPAPPTDTAPSEQAADGESPAEPEEAAEQETPKEIFERAKRYFSNCLTIEDLDTVWDTHFANLDLGSDDEAHLLSLYENAEAHINGKVVMA